MSLQSGPKFLGKRHVLRLQEEEGLGNPGVGGLTPPTARQQATVLSDLVQTEAHRPASL